MLYSLNEDQRLQNENIIKRSLSNHEAHVL